MVSARPCTKILLCKASVLLLASSVVVEDSDLVRQPRQQALLPGRMSWGWEALDPGPDVRGGRDIWKHLLAALPYQSSFYQEDGASREAQDAHIELLRQSEIRAAGVILSSDLCVYEADLATTAAP